MTTSPIRKENAMIDDDDPDYMAIREAEFVQWLRDQGRWTNEPADIGDRIEAAEDLAELESEGK